MLLATCPKSLNKRQEIDAAWNFNIFATNGFPSPIQTATHPINILFSLSSIDYSVACGYNHILQRKKSEFTSNEVFTSSRCGDVYKSTMHEFLHSLGLGHTWHEVDDMMCSTGVVPWYEQVDL